MKKIVLFLLMVCVVFSACIKQIKEKLYYTVTTYPDSVLTNVYIPDSGSYSMPVQVKFMSGNTVDAVSIWITGLPTGVTVTPDSFSELPTFTGDFVFTTKTAARGTYPITINSYTQTTGYQATTINLTVVPHDCASLFWGYLSGTNACSDRDYSFTSTGVSTGTVNNLTVNNFGGYGTNVNVTVLFKLNTDSLYIPLNNYGNGTILTGSGIFTNNTMIIWYSATTTPTGVAETCIDTLRFY